MESLNLSRRDFLKLAALASFSSIVPIQMIRQSQKPNIIMVVFDAWSAKNIGFLGYPRQTMPKLAKLADKAIVYHNHYAAGPWTIPGTSSLLTGTYPWTHHCISQEVVQLVNPKNNLFRLMKDAGYASVAATHNMYADMILSQSDHWLARHPHFTEMFLPTRFPFTRLFRKDIEVTGLAQRMAMWNTDRRYHSSIFLGEFFKQIIQVNLDQINQTYKDQFPRGVPQIPVLDMPFLLEDGIDHLLKTSTSFAQPQLSYYHYYPPHKPYLTRAEFYNVFSDDGITFPEKPRSHITEEQTYEQESLFRQHYDETLLYVDSEFNRLYQDLKNSGQLENTWLILTSDHGELFERGNIGHEIPMGYEALVKVPLLIFPPGQQTRVDIYTTTSAVDVLPTLLDLAGQPIPQWVEGISLPPFSEVDNTTDRAVYSVHGWLSDAKSRFSQGVVTMVKNGMKLIFTFRDDRLSGSDHVLELYDLAADPEELDNLYTKSHPAAQQMLAEMQAEIDRADQPFR
ncbi:MAG: sulfatase-like hydrolase/transferase [Anaerolineales bacterium]|nr:sulfatase-like hydrolase/transferase [Anaerolineales bacterium]